MSCQRTFLPQFPPTLHIPLFIRTARGLDSPAQDWRKSRHATRRSGRRGRAVSRWPILNLEEERKRQGFKAEVYVSNIVINNKDKTIWIHLYKYCVHHSFSPFFVYGVISTQIMTSFIRVYIYVSVFVSLH